MTPSLSPCRTWLICSEERPSTAFELMDAPLSQALCPMSTAYSCTHEWRWIWGCGDMPQGSIPTLGNICAWKPEQWEPGRCYSWGLWRGKWRWWKTGLFFLGYGVAAVWEPTQAPDNLGQPLRSLFSMSFPHALSLLSSWLSVFFSFLWTDLFFSLSSLLHICFLLCSFLRLAILPSSFDVWSMGEKRRRGLHGHREQRRAFCQAACPFHFSSLPLTFLLLFVHIGGTRDWRSGHSEAWQGSLNCSLSLFEMESR